MANLAKNRNSHICPVFLFRSTMHTSIADFISVIVWASVMLLVSVFSLIYASPGSSTPTTPSSSSLCIWCGSHLPNQYFTHTQYRQHLHLEVVDRLDGCDIVAWEIEFLQVGETDMQNMEKYGLITIVVWIIDQIHKFKLFIFHSRLLLISCKFFCSHHFRSAVLFNLLILNTSN